MLKNNKIVEYLRNFLNLVAIAIKKCKGQERFFWSIGLIPFSVGIGIIVFVLFGSSDPEKQAKVFGAIGGIAMSSLSVLQFKEIISLRDRLWKLRLIETGIQSLINKNNNKTSPPTNTNEVNALRETFKGITQIVYAEFDA